MNYTLDDQADCANALSNIGRLSHSDTVSERLNAVNLVLTAAESIGNDAGANMDLFGLIERLAYDDEAIIQTELLAQVPHLMIHCIKSGTLYSLNNHLLVPMLLHFLDNEKTQVRKQCHKSVIIALKQRLFSNDEIVCGFLPKLLRLSEQQNNSDDVRVEAVTLLCKLVPSLGREKTIELILNHLAKLCVDPLFHIRKVCASNLGDISKVVGPKSAEKMVVPHLIALSQDKISEVRKCCAECFPLMSDLCTMETRRHHLAPVFIALLSDTSRRVRIAAFRSLGQFISTFVEDSHGYQWFEERNALNTMAFDDLCSISCQSSEQYHMLQRMNFLESANAAPIANDQEQNYVFDPRIAQLVSLSVPVEENAFESDIDLSNNRSDNHINVQNRSELQKEAAAASLTPSLQLLCSSDKVDALLSEHDGTEGPSRPTFIKFDSEDVDEWSFASFKFWRAPLLQLSGVATDDVTKSLVDGGGLQLFMERHMPFATLTSPTDELLAVGPSNATNDLLAPSSNRVLPFRMAEKHFQGDSRKAVKAFDDFTACIGSDYKFEEGLTKQPSRKNEADAAGVSHSSHRLSLKVFGRLRVSPCLPGPEKKDYFGNDSNQKSVKCNEQESDATTCDDQSIYMEDAFDISYDDYEEEIDASTLMASSSRSNEVEDSPSQDIIPHELLDEFLSMVQPEQARNIESDISLHCAFSFPAVASTLGAENWPLIRSTYLTLASDSAVKVRRTLAFSIHELAANLGTDITTKDLLPVFTGFLHDSDEIRIGVLKNLSNFLKILDKNDRAPILAHLAGFLQTENKRNWRFRYLLAEQLILLCDLFDIKAINDYLSPIAKTLAIDKVSEIRLITHKLMAVIVTHFYREETRANGDDGPTFLTDSFIEDIIKGFAKAQLWIRRQTFVCVCQEIASLNVLPARKLVAELSATLCAMIEDRVPNVRLSLAKLLRRLDQIYFRGAAADGGEKENLQQAQLILRNDRDRDVRQAALPASTTTALFGSS